MPTWLKCTNCGEKYYTAKSYHFLEDKSCEKCGNKLKPKSHSYQQKRRYPRFEIDKKVEYQLEDDSINENFRRGKSIDLSLNGILMTTTKSSIDEVEKNKKVFLKLKDDNNELNLYGRIARITKIKRGDKSKLGLGIEFLNVDKEKKEILYKLQTKKLIVS